MLTLVEVTCPRCDQLVGVGVEVRPVLVRGMHNEPDAFSNGLPHACQGCGATWNMTEQAEMEQDACALARAYECGVPCDVCHGEGEVERDRYVRGNNADGFQAVRSSCDACEGTGRVDA